MDKNKLDNIILNVVFICNTLLSIFFCHWPDVGFLPEGIQNRWGPNSSQPTQCAKNKLQKNDLTCRKMAESFWYSFTSWRLAMVSITPMANPAIAMATDSSNTWLHSGMTANTSEMTRVQEKRASSEYWSLEDTEREDHIHSSRQRFSRNYLIFYLQTTFLWSVLSALTFHNTVTQTTLIKTQEFLVVFASVKSPWSVIGCAASVSFLYHTSTLSSPCMLLSCQLVTLLLALVPDKLLFVLDIRPQKHDVCERTIVSSGKQSSEICWSTAAVQTRISQKLLHGLLRGIQYVVNSGPG